MVSITRSRRAAGGGAGMALSVIIVVIALVVLWFFLKYASRECNYDNQCPKDYYCGSDFTCHEHIVINRTVVQTDYATPAAIIAIAIILVALLMRTTLFDPYLGRWMRRGDGHGPAGMSSHGHDPHHAAGGHSESDHHCYYSCAEHPMHPQYKEVYWKKK